MEEPSTENSNVNVASEHSHKLMLAGIDFLCIALLIAQMMYFFVPEVLHETLGIAFAMAILAHAATHGRWFKSFFRGKWNASRVVRTIVVFLAIICVLIMLISGLLMSSLAQLVGIGGRSLTRAAHLPIVYAGFTVMALHTGLHMRMRLPDTLSRRVVLIATCVVIFVCGVWSLQQLQFVSYISGSTRFAIVNATSPVLVLIQYILVFSMFALVGSFLRTLLDRTASK